MKKAEKYLNKKYEFYFDLVINRTYYKNKSCTGCGFSKVENFDLNSIHRELVNQGIKIHKNVLKDLLQSDFVQKRNPIIDYLNGLPQWNSIDYINILASRVKTTNDDLFKWAFKKWFVAMIASVINDDITNQCAIILIGKQGIGKSTYLESLLPLPLLPYLCSDTLNPNDKDTIIQLSESMLIIMEEIGSFRQKDVEAFKELITKSVIKKRRAYAVYAENYIRRASFVGSSNNDDILVDVTGNRRFLVFKALKFDSILDIDLNQAYAQGVHLLNTGFQYWFDIKDAEKMQEYNEQFRQKSLEEELLFRYFDKCKKTEKDNLLFSASEIVLHIMKEINQPLPKALCSISMGKVLKAYEFEETKVKGSKKYVVKKNSN